MHFLRESVVDIDAAVVGVSCERWCSIPLADATPERAAEVMRATPFDTLPIDDQAGVKEFFRTEVWNDYATVVRHIISHRDVIPFDVPLRTVIHAFATESRYFYFLGNERRVVGLISIANLNCRQVNVYLFSLLSELEIQLGSLIHRHCTADELLSMTFDATDDPKYAPARKRYESDRATGVDVPFVEYLYLSDFVKVIKKVGLFRQLGFPSAQQFQNSLGSLVELRHVVAHPTRSLVTDMASCKQLWDQIDRVEGLLFQLR